MIDKSKVIKESQFEFTTTGKPVDFPLYIFPKNIRVIIRRLKESSDFEPQIVGSSILFAASTIIGNSKKIRVKSTWVDTPNLWIAIVGRRGTMKTPTVNYCIKPLVEDEKEYELQFQKAVADYLSIPKKDREEERRPTRRQRYSNDPTVEGLIKAMSSNYNGMGIYKDELNGFFEEMNRYQSGGNMEFYLSAFSGGQYIKNRASYDTITVNDIYLSILGSIQPEKLKLLASHQTDNGMMDRWLFVESDNIIPNTTTEDISEEMTAEYKRFVYGLAKYAEYQSEMEWGDGALDEFINTLNLFENMMRSDECEDNLFTYLSKIKTYFARFAALIALLNGSTYINIDHVEKAASLSSYYIQTAINTFINFDNQLNVDLIFEKENAKNKRQKVLAIRKNLPDLNNTQIAKYVPCSRQYVINTLNSLQ